MGSDFVVVIKARQRFGDKKETQGGPDDEELVDVDRPATFHGGSGIFDFSCPNVDNSQQAILQFHYRGSEQRGGRLPGPLPGGGPVGFTEEEHPVSINGSDLAGGVPAGPSRGNLPLWGQRLLVINSGVLQEDNVLRIESNPRYWITSKMDGLEVRFPRRDDFTIDNAVVFYKTTSDAR